jgi:outer membrane protein OmpA-like peptidoglycan-associated protein
LSARGVDQTRVTTQGYGETNASFPNDSEKQRAANRRVDVRLTR